MQEERQRLKEEFETRYREFELQALVFESVKKEFA